MDMLRDIAGTEAREMRILFIELCGVFWIVAELVILFFVIEARRHLGRSPISAVPLWDRVSTRRALLFMLFALAALGAVVLRPLFWTPLSWRIQTGPLDVSAAAMLDFHAVLRHLTVWAAFVTVWVILEGAMVYQGYSAYRLFRKLVLAGGGGATRNSAGKTVGISPDGSSGGQGGQASLVVLLLLGAFLAAGIVAAPVFAAQALNAPAAKAVDSWEQVVQLSENGLYPYRNALYLYLRIAGVVWIGVEWIAAFVLWRAWRVVDHALRNGGGAS